ncbi:hypothetical protein [Streptomyces sp. NPDC056672]|uniref:hypothetical protein n=1 Tax=Streptomyces sp. NPDC056672 TaxID=3345906 RepID=UPI0036CACE36
MSNTPPRAYLDATGRTTLTPLHNRQGAKGKFGGSMILGISGNAPEGNGTVQGAPAIGVQSAALILPEDHVFLGMLAREMGATVDLLNALAEAKRQQPGKAVGELWAETAAAQERAAQERTAR